VAEQKKGIRILRSLTNAPCLHGEALVGALSEADFPGAVLETLERERGWDVLLFEHEYSFNGPNLLPAESLRASGLKWDKIELPTFVITLGKPFEEYFRKDLSRKRRSYIMNYVNKVERAGSGGYEHLKDEKATAAWEEFVAIEDAGWKGTAGTSVRRDHPLRNYYRGLLDLLAKQGRLRISFMTLGGRRIAGGFGYLQNGIFHLAKMGYHEEFGHYAPSNLLLLEFVKVMGEACPEVRKIHLFPWDHGYKHRFVNETAESVSTFVFNNTFRGHAVRVWRSYRVARTMRETGGSGG
jgi:CelD/BcsL family acetyltransferase involved in cellulose biosynthesis